ncbi:MAG: hypothetical protein R3D60_01900 [Paracoccaceae bacterium]
MAAEWVAFGLSLVWLTMIVVAFRLLGRQGMQMSDTLGLIVIALAVFLPIAVIWLSAWCCGPPNRCATKAAVCI